MLGLISHQHSSQADSDRRTSSPTPSSNTSSGVSDTPSTSDPEISNHYQDQRRTFLWVSILPEVVPWPAPFPVIDFIKSGPLNIRFTSFPQSTDPRTTSLLTLRAANPTVVFTSPFNLDLQASFSVFLDDGTLPIYSEVAPLIPTLQDCEWLYVSTLIPGYWKILSSSPGQFFRTVKYISF